MKSKYFKYLISVAAGLAVLSCANMDEMQDRYSRGDVAYAPKVDSVTVRGGDKRALTEVHVGSRLLESVRIYWDNNSKTDSADMAVNFTPGVYSIPLENIEENDYIFKAVGIDRYKNLSLPYTINGKVYGDRYQAMLSPRTVRLTNSTPSKTTIYWATAATDVFCCEVEYDDRVGTKQTLRVPNSENATDVTGMSGNLRYRTLFVPGANAIDTFYTAWRNIETASVNLPRPAGLWQFDMPGSITGRAIIGAPLELRNNSGHSQAISINSEGVVNIGLWTYFFCNHGITPKSGEFQINEFTVMMDVNIGSSGSWWSLYQADLSNGSDGDLWIRGSNGAIGVGDFGYSSRGISRNAWYRIVFSVKKGSWFRIYVNGELYHEANTSNTRFFLDPAGVLLFADKNGADEPISVKAIAIWDKPLTTEEIGLVGVVGDQVVAEQP